MLSIKKTYGLISMAEAKYFSLPGFPKLYLNNGYTERSDSSILGILVIL
jgi:hypothetical protein